MKLRQKIPQNRVQYQKYNGQTKDKWKSVTKNTEKINDVW